VKLRSAPRDCPRGETKGGEQTGGKHGTRLEGRGFLSRRFGITMKRGGEEKRDGGGEKVCRLTDPECRKSWRGGKEDR